VTAPGYAAYTQDVVIDHGLANNTVKMTR